MKSEKVVSSLVLILLSIVIFSCFVLFSGCTSMEYFFSGVKEKLEGVPYVIQSYDDNSEVIDRIEGNSVSISLDTDFDITDSKGGTAKKSSVLDITIGGKQMLHVGSSLIAVDKSLHNILDDVDTKVDINNSASSVPFINNIVNSYANMTTGRSKVILIRSQTGKPLATYFGSKVGYFATGIPKSTGLIVDGKRMFIYSCDYSIYDLDLLR